MRITVFHKEDQAFNRMCVVETPNDDIELALEYEYRWTNNIHGSWSRDDLSNTMLTGTRTLLRSLLSKMVTVIAQL